MEFLLFGGLAPKDLTALIYEPLSPQSIIGLRNDLTNEDLANLKMFGFVKQFLIDLQSGQPLKLTQKGNLNRKFIRQLYEHRIITSEHVDSGFIKLLKEDDFFPIHFAHFITKMAGLVKKYKNKLSLTKKGEKMLANDVDIYSELLLTYTGKYNWSYMTYDPDNIGQLGWGYSMLNFLRYGDVERTADFYSDKYLEVFHEMLADFPDNAYRTPQERLSSCFRRRFFGRFCDFFGFAEERIEGTSFQDYEYFFKKTPLVDKVFIVRQNLAEFGMN